jgi:hypothetical protein
MLRSWCGRAAARMRACERAGGGGGRERESGVLREVGSRNRWSVHERCGKCNARSVAQPAASCVRVRTAIAASCVWSRQRSIAGCVRRRLTSAAGCVWVRTSSAASCELRWCYQRSHAQSQATSAAGCAWRIAIPAQPAARKVRRPAPAVPPIPPRVAPHLRPRAASAGYLARLRSILRSAAAARSTPQRSLQRRSRRERAGGGG